MTEQADEYCGFLCSDIIERQQSILDDLKDFSQYNKEFAHEMVVKLMIMCFNYADAKDIHFEIVKNKAAPTTT